MQGEIVKHFKLFYFTLYAIINFWTPKIFCNLPGLTVGDADRMANSAEPDQADLDVHGLHQLICQKS